MSLTISRELDRVAALHFGIQPGDDCLEPRLPQKQLPFVGEGRSLIEPDQWLIVLDCIALADQQLLDDAALQMLDDLVLPGGDEAALCDDGRRKRRCEGPRAEAAEGHRYEQQADGRLSPDRTRNLGVPLQVVNFCDCCCHFSVATTGADGRSCRPRCSGRGTPMPAEHLLAHAEESDGAVDEQQYLVDALGAEPVFA